MKRLLTTLLILLIVLVTGLAALVALVNPNDFRHDMAKLVENRTGYQLTISGDLRWHIWPQLSILAGELTVTAPGASSPTLRAENARLDIKLWPLLKHQLEITHVFLKGAVIQIIPDSEKPQPKNAPIAPPIDHALADSQGISTQWRIEKIELANSLLIWQKTPNDQINIRDLNLQLSRTNNQTAEITLNARINRDQRNLNVSMQTTLDLTHYPNQLAANIASFSYQLQGAGLSTKGMYGQGAMTLNYQKRNQILEAKSTNFTLNGQPLQWQSRTLFGEILTFDLTVSTQRLDLERVLESLSALPVPSSDKSSDNKKSMPDIQPVTSGGSDAFSDFDVLQTFNGEFKFFADEINYKNQPIKKIQIHAKNQQGVITLEQTSAHVFGGAIEFKGQMMPRNQNFAIQLEPNIENISAIPFAATLGVPEFAQGQLSLKGVLKHTGVKKLASWQNWQADTRIKMKDVTLRQLNIQQLIKDSIPIENFPAAGLSGSKEYGSTTELLTLQLDAFLQPEGLLTITDLEASSNTLNIIGKGTIDINKQLCKLNLGVQILSGWQGRPEIVQRLEKTKIPLTIFGPCHQLNYQVDIKQLIQQYIRVVIVD